MSDQPNPYAPPLADSDFGTPSFGGASGGLQREGDLLLIPAMGVSFPPRCVVCNQPGHHRLKRTLYWHPPAYYLIICAGWLFYVIVALIVRKSASFEIGLCDEHAARRRNGILIGWLGGVGCLVAGIALIETSPALMLVLVVAAFAAMIGGLLMARTVQPARIRDGWAWIKVGRPFLDSLPRA
jgi:hypothetical protein